MSKKLTTEEFIFRSKKFHNDEFDYFKSSYINAKTKIEIICKIHGSFWTLPYSHMIGHKCQKCVGNFNYDITEFIKKIKEIKYDYSKSIYKNCWTKIEIVCKNHGSFWQTPDHHLRGQGCPKCIGKNKSTGEFIIQSNIKYGNLYDYSKFVYINSYTKGEIICKDHGSFWQTPGNHLYGYGCIKCGRKNIGKLSISNTKEFIKKSILIHKNLFDYDKVNYINAFTKVEIMCKKHGSFLQTPNHHLTGNGCPSCGKTMSKPEIEFLDYLKIPDTKENRQKYIKPYRIDGYDNKTNTIYEFLGDYFHGNPEKYKNNDINRVNKKSFKQLYENTFKRFKLLVKMGYKIKYIWESDWNKFKKKETEIPYIIDF